MVFIDRLKNFVKGEDHVGLLLVNISFGIEKYPEPH